MKKIVVIGAGISVDTLTFEARNAINNAGVLAGAQRMLDLVSGLYNSAPKRLYPYYLPNEILDMIVTEETERFAVLVSGDVGFFSAAAGLADALSAYDVSFIPGVSTVNAFFARLKLSWHDVAFVSAHGRETDIVGCVRRNRLTFCLTGSNVNELGAKLTQSGFGLIKTYVGENLGTEQERVYEAIAEDLERGEFPSLTVLLFQNEEFDDTTPTGLPDSGFLRLEGIPMTKSETRSLVMSKLNLKPDAICYDVGAGTGSVTIEMALSAYRGHVYAVERRKEAIHLVNRNRETFRLGNVSAICGEAPGALEPLPAPDAVFIGGSGGELGSIIKAVLDKKANTRIVITAVTIETVSMALAAFKDTGLDPEITQMNVSRGKRVGGLHMMEAQNPITILSAGGKP